MPMGRRKQQYARPCTSVVQTNQEIPPSGGRSPTRRFTSWMLIVGRYRSGSRGSSTLAGRGGGAGLGGGPDFRARAFWGKPIGGPGGARVRPGGRGGVWGGGTKRRSGAGG